MNDQNEAYDAALDCRLIYDVGMHRGQDTGYYLRKGFHVVAFEANDELVAQAKLNFHLQLDSGQLTIVEGAIVDASEWPGGSEFVSFFINKDVSEWGTAHPGIASKNVPLGTNVFEVRVRCGRVVASHTPSAPPKKSLEGSSNAYQFPFGSSGLFGTDLNSRWFTRDQIAKKIPVYHAWV